MFDPGFDQAAGLRMDAQACVAGPALMPLASPAQPSRGFEWLCRIAMDLSDLGHKVVVLDACATERSAQGGLLHALNDGSVAHVGAAEDNADWLVMPGAQGLQSLVATAAAGGPDVALSRLFAPFAPGAIVLLYASAQALASLLGGVSARVMVPVIDQPQSSIDAYGALKWLHAVGLCPVLAPLNAAPQVLANVSETALRHLGLQAPVWAQPTWAQRVPGAALVRTQSPNFLPERGLRAGNARSLWS